MRFLRTNTAVRLTVGPFFDKTDGVTPETALTVTGIKLTLMVDDGNVPTLVLDTNPTASGGANDMVHVTGDDAGFYDLELAAANVNYLGRAMLALTDAANHCPVFHEFMILPAMVYDSLVLGTDDLDTNTKKWNDLTTVALPLIPTTAGRTLDVSAGGEAGVDWANVGSPTTVVGLSGTTVKTATDVETDTQDIQARLPAALTAGGNIKADALAISGDATAADNLESMLDGTGGVDLTIKQLAATDGIVVTRSTANQPAIKATGNGTGAGIEAQSGAGATGNGVTANSNATNGYGVRATGAGTGSGLLAQGGATGNGLEGVGGATSGSGADFVAAAAGHGVKMRGTGTGDDSAHGLRLSAGSAGNNSGLRAVTGAGGFGVHGDIHGSVDGSVASVTAGVTVAVGGVVSGAHAAAELNAIADALLDRNMATGTDSGTNSTATRTVRQALRRLRNKESIAAGTLTVTKEDDSTTSWTAGVTTTAGDPLSAVDPT